MNLGGPPLSAKTKATILISRGSQSPEVDVTKLHPSPDPISATQLTASKIVALADYHAKKQITSRQKRTSTDSPTPMSPTYDYKASKPRKPAYLANTSKAKNFTSEATSSNDDNVPPVPYYRTRASLLRQKPSISKTPSISSQISEKSYYTIPSPLLPSQQVERRSLIVTESEESFKASVGGVKTKRVASPATLKARYATPASEEPEQPSYRVSNSYQPSKDDILSVNTVLNNRWTITEKMRFGRHIQNFKARDQELDKDVCVKVSKTQNYSLDRESQLLKALEIRADIYKYISFEEAGKIPYLVTELEGPTLQELRTTYGAFSLSTVVNLGIKMIEALQTLHSRGWIHTDISPDSFTVGIAPDKWRNVSLNDYGLARKTIRGRIPDTPPDNRLGMHSDPHFASLNALSGREFDKIDDVWSVVFTILYLKSNQLPWSLLTSNQAIKNSKRMKLNQAIVKHLGATFKSAISLLNRARFGDRPDYDRIIRVFENMKRYYTIQEGEKFEWEANPQRIFVPDKVEATHVKALPKKKWLS